MSGPTVCVVIPWGPSSDSHRLAALQVVKDLYEMEFPNWELVVAAEFTPGFSRARAINNAAWQTDAEILVRNDADSLVRPGNIRDAVLNAWLGPGQVKAYTRYRRVSESTTRALHAEGSSYPDVFTLGDDAFDWEQDPAQSHGCVAMRTENFLEVGGYDPRFVGWGYDDLSLDHYVQTLWEPRRIKGDLLHLWHPTDPTCEYEHPQNEHNRTLHGRYERAAGDPAALRALREEANAIVVD